MNNKEQQQKIGWVACAESMPEPLEWVIIAVNGAPLVGAYCLENDLDGPCWYPHGDGGACQLGEVTHWMPWPVAPLSVGDVADE